MIGGGVIGGGVKAPFAALDAGKVTFIRAPPVRAGESITATTVHKGHSMPPGVPIRALGVGS
uniref:Ker1 n=1 Tax=Amycolatopsis keratiniphila TaxID=129921 RepID=A0A385L3H6_9PSEU|nr:Ker1 [Amycolatopsis keratiniphila]